MAVTDEIATPLLVSPSPWKKGNLSIAAHAAGWQRHGIAVSLVAVRGQAWRRQALPGR